MVGVFERWLKTGGVIAGCWLLTRDFGGVTAEAAAADLTVAISGAEAVALVLDVAEVGFSRLIWLVGGDDRRMFIVVVVVGGITFATGRTVLAAAAVVDVVVLAGETCIGIVPACGILLSRDGFCFASVFLNAAMLAGFEMWVAAAKLLLLFGVCRNIFPCGCGWISRIFVGETDWRPTGGDTVVVVGGDGPSTLLLE